MSRGRERLAEYDPIAKVSAPGTRITRWKVSLHLIPSCLARGKRGISEIRARYGRAIVITGDVHVSKWFALLSSASAFSMVTFIR